MSQIKSDLLPSIWQEYGVGTLESGISGTTEMDAGSQPDIAMKDSENEGGKEEIKDNFCSCITIQFLRLSIYRPQG